MRIEIAERFRPYSHLPGIKCPVPGAEVIAEVFPGRLVLGKREFIWKLTGPIRDFTCELDLEKGWIRVFGKSVEGYFAYRIVSEEKGIEIIWDKGKGENHLVPVSTSRKTSQERLSFGVTKAQEWERIKNRCEMAEIFPMWLKLAGFFPLVRGNSTLLEECREKMDKRKEILPSFEKLFLASFSGMFAPRAFDEEYQNILKDGVCTQDNPFALLTEGAHLIRSLLLREEKESLFLLPCLPSEFSCGRFLAVLSFGRIEIEWSKKMLRRVMVKSERKGHVRLVLPSETKEFRMRTSLQDKGAKVENGFSLSLEEGKNYLLDRFQK